MKWFTFSTRQAFDAWHDGIKELLGYPLPSRDSDNNIVGEPFTTEYTSCVEVAPGDFRSLIDEQYADGLTPSTMPVFPDERHKS